MNNKRLISYHDKNERQSAQGIIQLIKNGDDVVVVSDAGMPVLNDPGFLVIKEAIANDIEIEIVPGVSAVTTAAVIIKSWSAF